MSDDFWNRLIEGHTGTTLHLAMDQHLSSKTIGDGSFETVRALTDQVRKAKALQLPVEAGTKVVFAGDLGVVLAYGDVPEAGVVGEVVSVKSAAGEVTSHEGMVFVQWGDGKFRSIHAEHLRLAEDQKKVARDRFKDMDGNPFDVGAQAEWWPNGQFSGTGTVIGVDGRNVLFGDPRGNNPATVPPDEIRVVRGKRAHLTGDQTIRVARIGDLTEFLKVADGHLVHKSTRDLWSFSKDADGGGFVVSRLFDDDGNPLKV